MGHVKATECQGIEADIYEQEIDTARSCKVRQCTGKVACGQRSVPQFLNHPLEILENEKIILYDKDDGHQ